MKITAKQIKGLRDETGAGMMEVKGALEAAKGDKQKAKVILAKMGLKKAEKRGDKETSEGRVEAYVHAGNSVVGVVKVNCETDFVAKAEELATLGKELAMQVASMEPKDVKELLGQSYIRDAKKKVQDLVDEVAAKVKEKVVVSEIYRMSL